MRARAHLSRAATVFHSGPAHVWVGHDIHLRLHGGEERVVRNHDPARVQRLLRGNHTGCWISGSGSLLSIDMGPAQSFVVSVTTGELGECGPNGEPGA